jgi:hypothetical protein
MALLDLRFPMPISTRSNDYSPDGVFGTETENVVKAFQRSMPPPGLTPDGVVGQLTMRELDKRFPKFTHRFNLHFRSLALSSVPFDRLLSGTAQVYAQYGIEARFANGQSLGLSPDEEARYNVVKQNCDWVMDSGEFAELHRLGTPKPNNDMAVSSSINFRKTFGVVGGARDQSAGLCCQPRSLAMELSARNLPRIIDVELYAGTHRQPAQPHVSQRIPSLGIPRAD